VRIVLSAVLTVIILAVTPAWSTPTISLGELPTLSENREEGELIGLIKLMEAAEGSPIKYFVVPMMRSLTSVSSGASDVHMPMIDPGKGASPMPGLMFSNATLGEVPFSVFHKTDSEIDVSGLKGLLLESPPQTSQLFDFTVNDTNCLPCSMKKLALGRIDGVILGQMVGDEVLKTEGILNVTSTPLAEYSVRFVLRDGDTETDQWLSDMMNGLRTSHNLEFIVPSFSQKSQGVGKLQN
jgi:hypothetical protein